MQIISNYTTWVNIASILIVLILAWRYRSAELLKKFSILLAVLVLSALIIYLLKNAIDRERPFITYYPAIEKLSTGGDSSFPSGHTTESFALATAFSFLFRRKNISVLCFGWAILVGYTRMALGVHYPTDVLAGVIFGILIGFVLPYYGYKLLYSDKQKTDNQ